MAERLTNREAELLAENEALTEEVETLWAWLQPGPDEGSTPSLYKIALRLRNKRRAKHGQETDR